MTKNLYGEMKTKNVKKKSKFCIKVANNYIDMILNISKRVMPSNPDSDAEDEESISEDEDISSGNE